MLLGGPRSLHRDLAQGDTVILRTGEERVVKAVERDTILPCKWLVHLEGMPNPILYADSGAVWGSDMLSLFDIIERR